MSTKHQAPTDRSVTLEQLMQSIIDAELHHQYPGVLLELVARWQAEQEQIEDDT